MGRICMLSNHDTISKIVERYEKDEDVLELMGQILESFQSYHAAIYKLELQMKLYSHGRMDGDAYRNSIAEMDATRTINHNAVIANVRVLNRIADQYDLPPFYEGVISEERPYRRELANAVLEYVETVARNRI